MVLAVLTLSEMSSYPNAMCQNMMIVIEVQGNGR